MTPEAALYFVLRVIALTSIAGLLIVLGLSWRDLICWWFGCKPHYEALRQDWSIVPCERCHALDVSYSDRVGDTRHRRLVDRLQHLRWRLFESWRPARCPACGQRGKCAADCDGIPF